MVNCEYSCLVMKYMNSDFIIKLIIFLSDTSHSFLISRALHLDKNWPSAANEVKWFLPTITSLVVVLRDAILYNFCPFMLRPVMWTFYSVMWNFAPLCEERFCSVMWKFRRFCSVKWNFWRLCPIMWSFWRFCPLLYVDFFSFTMVFCVDRFFCVDRYNVRDTFCCPHSYSATYLFMYPSINSLSNLPTCLSINQSTSLYIYEPLYPPMYLFTYLCLSLSIALCLECPTVLVRWHGRARGHCHRRSSVPLRLRLRSCGVNLRKTAASKERAHFLPGLPTSSHTRT